MDILEKQTGFSLQGFGTCFEFDDKLDLTEDREFYRAEVLGNIPVPQICPDDRLILPIDEGIAIEAGGEYECADFNLNDFTASFCGREGTLNMIIIEREKKFLLIALTDGTNASYRVKKEDGLYRLTINATEKTTVVYKIFEKLIDACKAYREIKVQDRVLLSSKIEKNPEIKKLAYGGMFWIWSDKAAEVMYSETNTDANPCIGDDILPVADELYNSGVKNALIGLLYDEDSYLSEPLYKQYGYIVTQYDNYNDALNPELLDKVPGNRVRNCGYVRRRMKDYPEGIRISEEGKQVDAWALKGFDGEFYNQKSVCPVVAAKSMEKEVGEIIKKYPYYKGRFIDVYGCGLADCYSEEHPVTRTECVAVKNGAYKALADLGLVIGTEDGFEDIMNSIVYSEGMHSPVAFRYKNAGRCYMFIHNEEQSEYLEKNMLNPEMRVPLWQMVNHECMMSLPYWGISTAGAKDVMQKKVLFACLFGCPPLYSFSKKDFHTVKDDILKSYKTITSVCKKVVELPMTDFEVLEDDYSVLRTEFGEKYEIVANFSDEVKFYKGKEIKSLDFIMEEL